MWVKRVEIENFKSFFRTETIDFSQGFNLILGANNAGKSTLIQALNPSSFADVPHKSVATIPTFGLPVAGSSRVCLTWTFSVAELRQLQGGRDTYLFASQGAYLNISAQDPADLCRRVLDDILVADLERNRNGFRARLSGKVVASDWINQHSGAFLLRLQEQVGGPPSLTLPGGNHGSAPSMLHEQLTACAERFYRFDARRFSPVEGPLVVDGRLNSSASNLPGCITWLQTTDPEGHRQLCEWVHRVLPHVHSIQASPSATSTATVELRCYPRPVTERRSDLSVSIGEMGAGVANVVAILFVVLTSRHPQIICIDEPNQFLHPKALRELLNILAIEGRAHQYILTAHSAEVIGAIKAETVTLLSLDDGQTRVRQAKHNDLALLKDGLADLGIRATELHGRDQVLWVEGQTEELVFPSLLANFCTPYAAGTAVLRVHDTGAFERKGFDPIKAVEIYERLTTASALVPPMVAIILDSETRSEQERERLETDRRGRLRFLPRRMLENFLLNPRAIAVALNEREADAATVDGVIEVMCRSAGVTCIEQIDLQKVDGANVLSQVFSEMTEARWEFKKTRDVPIMVDWLLVNEVDSLKPLGNWLSDLIAEANGSS